MSWFDNLLNGIGNLGQIQGTATNQDQREIDHGGVGNPHLPKTHVRGGQSQGLGDNAPDYDTDPAGFNPPVNFPYRGAEQHGVKATVAPYTKAPDEWDYYSPPESPAEHIPDPIRVKVVDEASRELRTFRTYQTTVNAQPSTIATRQRHRKNVKIKNMSATIAIVVGNGVGLSVASGYPIAALEVYTLDQCEDAIWAVSADGSQVNIAISQEYTIVEDNG